VGRIKRGDKEYDLTQRLKHDNKILKKRITSLRKQIARIDLDRYHNIRDLLSKYKAEDKEKLLEKEEEKIRNKWKCHSCTTDYLRLIIITRRDGMYYYRKCGNCDNRTKLQKYHEKIEGVK